MPKENSLVKKSRHKIVSGTPKPTPKMPFQRVQSRNFEPTVKYKASLKSGSRPLWTMGM